MNKIEEGNRKRAKALFERSVRGSREAKEDFNDMPEDNAIIWADDRIAELEAEVERLRSLPYDGYAVYKALTDSAQKRTSPENVSDVLDAIALLTKSGTAEKGE